MAKAKLPKTEKEPWNRSDKINSALAILTFVALVITGISTCISKNGLDLQQKQYADFQKKDSLNAISDSIKNEKYMELTQQQIDALKEQVVALNRGVRNTEVSQRPFLNIARLGFQIANKNEPDSVILLYKVNNYGYRPSMLKTTKVFIINKDFKLISKHKTIANTILTKEKNFQETIRLFFGENQCLICDIDDILNSGNLYFCFIIEYTDPFMSQDKKIKEEPIFYKWVKRNKFEMIKYSASENDIFYSADICKNQDEISKILKVVNANKI